MAKLFPVAKSTTFGLRIDGYLTKLSAERKVLRGELKREEDGGELVGYSRIENQGFSVVETSTDSTGSFDVFARSSASITPTEMALNAGTKFKGGRSKTARFHQDSPKRHGRIHPITGRVLPPEDGVERVVEKVRQFGESRLVCA